MFKTLIFGFVAGLVGTIVAVYYVPVERGLERELGRRLDWFVEQRAKRQAKSRGSLPNPA